jgi:hypothetical protein
MISTLILAVLGGVRRTAWLKEATFCGGHAESPHTSRLHLVHANHICGATINLFVDQSVWSHFMMPGCLSRRCIGEPLPCEPHPHGSRHRMQFSVPVSKHFSILVGGRTSSKIAAGRSASEPCETILQRGALPGENGQREAVGMDGSPGFTHPAAYTPPRGV